MLHSKYLAALSAMLWYVLHLYGQNFNIVIDYSLDTNNFFGTQERRDALQAAADRWSNIITSQLTAVGPGGTSSGTGPGWRVGLVHPGTGANWQISTATSSGADPIFGAGGGLANQYGFAGLNANEWLLFAGGRSLGGPAGIGGTGTGTNFTSTFNDLQGPMHRGVISNNPGNTVNDLPAWGGFVSFETSTVNWHFGINTAAPLGQTDFYSIALHEIGHALGLSVGFNQWLDFQSSATFLGPQAVAALNADNNSSATFLNQVSATNRHWQDGTHQSFIFSAGNPNLAGTVGLGVLQDLLMEPTANFTGSLRRFEVTNVEVGALQDLGWSVLSIPEPTTLALLGCLIVFTCYSYSQQQNKSASKPITADKSCITEQHYLSQV